MNAGWFPDPDGSQQLRWWDGRQWTSDTQPVRLAVNTPRSKYVNGLWFIGVVAVLAIIFTVMYYVN